MNATRARGETRTIYNRPEPSSRRFSVVLAQQYAESLSALDYSTF